MSKIKVKVTLSPIYIQEHSSILSRLEYKRTPNSYLSLYNIRFFLVGFNGVQKFIYLREVVQTQNYSPCFLEIIYIYCLYDGRYSLLITNSQESNQLNAMTEHEIQEDFLCRLRSNGLLLS